MIEEFESKLVKLSHKSDWQLGSLLRFAVASLQELPLDREGIEEVAVMHALAYYFGEAAQAYYLKGLDLIAQQSELADNPHRQRYLRRQLINRIGAEWKRVTTLIATSQIMPADDDSIKALRKVIYAAWNNLEVESRKVSILPHFARHFELVTFLYAPDITILGIPATSLFSPWEWTIVWHELAGFIMHTHSGHSVAAAVEQTMLDQGVWEGWRAEFKDELGYLFQENDIPTETAQQGWAEEFVEDAVGVLCLGDAMVDGLEEILGEHYAASGDALPPDTPEAELRELYEKTAQQAPPPPEDVSDEELAEVAEVSFADERHPLPILRIQVARALIHLMGLSAEDATDAGARQVARAIYEKRDRLVKQVFSATDKAEVDEIVRSFNQPENINQVPAHILIPAAMRIFLNRDQSTTNLEQQLLKLVHHALKDEARPDGIIENHKATVEQLKTYKQPYEQRKGTPGPTPFQAWQDKLEKIANWDDLLKLLFSESDEAEATVTSHGQHGIASIRVWVKVSNLDYEGTSHDGTYWRWHHHTHRD